ncbi:hypothetical protein ACMV8I_02865 [Ewingella sp. S1.OA.A_B6]
MAKNTVSTLALVLMLSVSSLAHAAGCIKGAVVGGVAGHLRHHAVLGAVAGCAVGHHMAAKAKAEQANAATK